MHGMSYCGIASMIKIIGRMSSPKETSPGNKARQRTTKTELTNTSGDGQQCETSRNNDHSEMEPAKTLGEDSDNNEIQNSQIIVKLPDATQPNRNEDQMQGRPKRKRRLPAHYRDFEMEKP